jgi:hypothetical protein
MAIQKALPGKKEIQIASNVVGTAICNLGQNLHEQHSTDSKHAPSCQ